MRVCSQPQVPCSGLDFRVDGDCTMGGVGFASPGTQTAVVAEREESSPVLVAEQSAL